MDHSHHALQYQSNAHAARVSGDSMHNCVTLEQQISGLISYFNGYEVRYDAAEQIVATPDIPLELMAVIPHNSANFQRLEQAAILPMGDICSQSRLNYSVSVVHNPNDQYPWRLWILPDAVKVESMVRNLGLPIMHLDSHWTADYANVEAAALLGVNPDELIERGWVNYIPYKITTDLVEHFRKGMGNISTYSNTFGYTSPLGRKCVIQIIVSQYQSIETGKLQYSIVLTDATAHHAAEEKLRQMALHDSMTQLYNRQAFIEKLEQLPDNVLRRGALVFIDVDNFKEINDTHGHSAGDQVITITGLRLLNNLRSRDFAARFGGDEFVVLIDDAKGGAEHVIDKLSTILSQDYHLNDCMLEVEFSIGFVQIASQKDIHNLSSQALIDNLLERADLAMYKAKQKKGTRCVEFDQKLKESAQKQRLQYQELETLLNNERVTIHFQPIVREGYIVSVEALFRHPMKYYDNTSDIIADITTSRNPAGIYRLLIESTLAAYKQVVSNLNENTYIPTLNLNVEITQLNHENFVGELVQLVNKFSLKPHKIFVEITETDLEDNPQKLIDVLESIKQAGFNLSVDDFGTGYSSIKRLTQSSFNQLKIDRYFLNNIHKNKDYQAMLKAIIIICKDLHIEALAEGIESAEEVALLQEYGVDVFQGYYFHKVLPPEQVRQIIIEKNHHV